MMQTNFAMCPEAVAISRATSKQDVLEQLSRLFARGWSLDAELVLERLLERERLGSTGFGRGLAIPHARIPGINRPVAALLRLEKPIAFEAADGLPVDVVIGLLSPEQGGATHLYALAAISRLMRDQRMHEALLQAPDVEAIFALITNVTDRDAA